MAEPKDRGFFDKINNAFFVIVDSGLDFLEKRGWNVPIETRFFFHALIFIGLFYLASSLILDIFFLLEALLVVLIFLTFGVANIRPIRQLLGYYSSNEKIHTIVHKIINNQISIKEVVDHLNKNLLPPHLTLSIIHAYQKTGSALPPDLIRAVLRQPTSLEIAEEVAKNDLTDSDFSLMMRKYKNLLGGQVLIQVIKSQKISESKLRDVLFFQESAYKAMKEIAAAVANRELVPLLWLEKDSYQKNHLLKNFLRNHHIFLSVAIPLIIAIALFTALHLLDFVIASVSAALLWIILYQFFYFYVLQYAYFKI